MEYEIAKTTVRGISTLKDSDVKTSLLGDMAGGKAIQCIAPQFSKSGKGEMIIWLENA